VLRGVVDNTAVSQPRESRFLRGVAGEWIDDYLRGFMDWCFNIVLSWVRM
jgi:hypothetical protein